jgi:hypothetical protein
MQDENAAISRSREGEKPTTERGSWRGRVGKGVVQSSFSILLKGRD